MNLVTGVFVDGAQRIAREEKNQVPVCPVCFSGKDGDSKGLSQTPLGRFVFFQNFGWEDWRIGITTFKFCDMFQCGLQCYWQ